MGLVLQVLKFLIFFLDATCLSHNLEVRWCANYIATFTEVLSPITKKKKTPNNKNKQDYRQPLDLSINYQSTIHSKQV